MKSQSWIENRYASHKRRAATYIERFWSRVDKRQEDDCWPWLGTTNQTGYGVVRLGGRYEIAHRVAWQIHNNRVIPEALFGCHSCDNPVCCNPNHIFLGTPADNSSDMVRKGRSHSPADGGPNAKLTRSDADAIYSLKGTRKQLSVAEQFGVSQSTVSLIWNERIWARA